MTGNQRNASQHNSIIFLGSTHESAFDYRTFHRQSSVLWKTSWICLEMNNQFKKRPRNSKLTHTTIYLGTRPTFWILMRQLHWDSFIMDTFYVVLHGPFHLPCPRAVWVQSNLSQWVQYRSPFLWLILLGEKQWPIRSLFSRFWERVLLRQLHSHSHLQRWATTASRQAPGLRRDDHKRAANSSYR